MLSTEQRPKFIDLFAGCGGLSLGLMQAGWTGLFAIEKSPMAFETLKFNLIDKDDKFSYSWPGWLPKRSLSIQWVLNRYKDELSTLEGIDLLAGGPPCQGFSVAGRRDVNDARNKLVNDYLRFVKLIKPKFILLENVRTFATSFSKTERGLKGIPITKKQYNADDYLQRRLQNLGYRVYVKNPVMAKDFGVPQLRPRYILIGVRTDLFKKALPKDLEPFQVLESNRVAFLSSLGLPAEEIPLLKAVGDLAFAHGTVQCSEPGMNRFKQGLYGPATTDYQELMRKCRDGNRLQDGEIADSHRFANHNESTAGRFQKIILSYTPGKQLTKDQVKSFGLQKHRVALLSANEVCHTLTSLPDDLVHYDEPRILTVREYARIQSFPDWFEFKSKYTTGGQRRRDEVPRYTQAANAVPPLLAQALGSVLYNLALSTVSSRKNNKLRDIEFFPQRILVS